MLKPTGYRINRTKKESFTINKDISIEISIAWLLLTNMLKKPDQAYSTQPANKDEIRALLVS